MGKANKVDTVKVGVKTYRIEKPLEIIQVGGEYYGVCDSDTSVIKIADKFEQQDKNISFLHELLHGICKRFSMRELNKDEQTIDLLATGIYEVIKDNPHIFTMVDI